jgi:hypothetical protein
MATGNAIQSAVSGAANVNDAQAVGLSFWSLDPRAAATGHGPNAQVMCCHLVRPVKSETISKLGIWVGGAGTTPGAGINGLAIYTLASLTSATLLGQSADATTAFETPGYTELSIQGGGVAVTALKDYYLCLVHNFTGGNPVFPASSAPPGTLPEIRSYFMAIFFGGQASFPASFNPNSNTGLLAYAHVITAGT